ncbi:MAG: hypothetical protein AAF604_23400 [Acidobacteriota bacterium]
MLAGHFTTALAAQQQAPRGHLAYYLVASQLPDMLWLVFHYLGLEPTEPHNVMNVSLDNLQVVMTYSHDLLPILGWIALTTLAGWLLFRSWRPALTGGMLIIVHAVTDYIGGFPHNLFGPDTHSVGTGLYYTYPYLAVALEAVFTVAVMAWVLRTDARAGIRRHRTTWAAWLAVFGGGVAFMFLSADLSLIELTGMNPLPALAGSTIPAMFFIYGLMFAVLLWADRQPTSRTDQPARS